MLSEGDCGHLEATAAAVMRSTLRTRVHMVLIVVALFFA